MEEKAVQQSGRSGAVASIPPSVMKPGFDVLSEAADERHLWRSGETGKPTAGSEADDAIGELGFEEAAGHGEAAELVVDSVGGEGDAVAQRNVR